MGGGLLDLVAKGGQDIYFVCNPEVSFFKKVYKRHTNFAIEQQKYLFDGDINFGRTSTFTIPRQGDLLKSLFIQFELPNINTNPDTNITKYVNYIGYSLIDYIEISIGEQVIDRLTGEWMYIINELSYSEDKKEGYNNMVGGNNNFSNYRPINGTSKGNFIVPINFWFTKDIGLALPLVSLQYHDVKITLKLKPLKEIFISQTGSLSDEDIKITKCNISLEYIYLDSIERRLFAQNNHEYLIKQTQYNLNNHISANLSKKRIDLNFNHPVIELVFVVQRKDRFTTSANSGNDYFNYSSNSNFDNIDTIKNAQILLNNEERTPLMSAKECRYLNVINTHTSIPNNVIYVYSFSMNPESFQPSGSCNFSRFDNKELALEFVDNIAISEVKVFAVNYNILRISKGMGGLAYIN